MKKVLFASTALVAFGLAGAAQASDPIKLSLGGYSKWVVSYADNNVVTGAKYQSTDVKGANQIYVKGGTTLDNGLKIAAEVRLEAGGNSDMATDMVDQSFVTVSGGFGTVMAGTMKNGAYLLHVSAPDAGGFSEDSRLGIPGGAYLAQGNLSGKNQMWTTAITLPTTGGKGDNPETITYVAPSFAGFTVGASYIPSLDEDVRGASVNNAVSTLGLAGDTAGAGAKYGVSDVIGFAGMYNNTFGAVSLKASLAYAFAADTSSSVDHLRQLTAGAQLGYAGFTVGGAYKKMWSALSSGATLKGTNALGTFDLDGTVWTAGAQYAQGPYAISFDYFTAKSGGDGVQDYHFAGKYNLGAGVDLIGMVGYGNFDNGYKRYNDGWVVATGIALAF